MATDSVAYETFRSNVRLVMKVRGITQVELAELTGLHQPAISAMLGGKMEPLLSKAQRISEALQVDLGMLFDADLSEDRISRASGVSA